MLFLSSLVISGFVVAVVVSNCFGDSRQWLSSSKPFCKDLRNVVTENKVGLNFFKKKSFIVCAKINVDLLRSRLGSIVSVLLLKLYFTKCSNQSPSYPARLPSSSRGIDSSLDIVET